MYRLKTLLAGAFLILILSGVTSPAKAGFVDLRSQPGNFDQSTFGQTNTVLYAQSVIADNVFMNEARATLKSDSGTNLNFNFMITGSRSDVGGLGFAPNLLDIRFNSGTLTALANTPNTEFTVNPNISVTVSERLFLVFDAFSYPGTGSGTIRATQFNAAVDPYPQGEYVYFNRGTQTTFTQVNAANWSHRSPNNEDLAIYASFNNGPVNAVPAPAGLLLGLTGLPALGLAGWVRRRRAAIGV